jgi:membrane-associated phospholipid phosphatase
MKINTKTLLVISLILIAFTILSIFYIDRGLALYIHNNGIDANPVLTKITKLMPKAVLLLIFVVILLKREILFVQKIILAVFFYISLLLTIEIKIGLKIIFGRYWPKTWINNNLSLITDNIYGFNFFHGFANQGSFPSGHSTYIAFCSVWLCVLYPRLLLLCLILMVIMPICLILLDYHFLGDCLAGILLGINSAALSYIIYKKLVCRIKGGFHE